MTSATTAWRSGGRPGHALRGPKAPSCARSRRHGSAAPPTGRAWPSCTYEKVLEQNREWPEALVPRSLTSPGTVCRKAPGRRLHSEAASTCACGTYSAYRRHLKRGEMPDAACAEAARERGRKKAQYDRDRRARIGEDLNRRARERDAARRTQMSEEETAQQKARDREYQRKYRSLNKPKLAAKHRDWRASNPVLRQREIDRGREYKFNKRHEGMDRAGVAAMLEQQGGVCYLCHKPLTVEAARVDHHHGCCPRLQSCSKCRRGAACNSCNLGIGYFRDNPALLHVVADRLEMANFELDISGFPPAAAPDEPAARVQVAQRQLQSALFEMEGAD